MELKHTSIFLAALLWTKYGNMAILFYFIVLLWLLRN
jgi:hypothetical protein